MTCVKLLQVLLPVTAALGFTAASALGQAIVPPFNNYTLTLGGTTSDYLWQGFSSETRPSGVGAGTAGKASQWLSGILPSASATGPVFSGDAANPYDYTDFAATANGGGIYAFFTQTHFEISSSTPLQGLQSLTLQIYLAEGLTSATGGTARALANAPLLLLTTSTGTYTVAPTYSSTSLHDSAFVNGSNSYLDLLNYEWDLSSVSGTPESYVLAWQTSYHSITFGEDLTESTATNTTSVLAQAVPEPSTAVALLGGCGILTMWRRRPAVC